MRIFPHFGVESPYIISLNYGTTLSLWSTFCNVFAVSFCAQSISLRECSSDDSTISNVPSSHCQHANQCYYSFLIHGKKWNSTSILERDFTNHHLTPPPQFLSTPSIELLHDSFFHNQGRIQSKVEGVAACKEGAQRMRG